jgi:hypothetical protein
LQITTLVPDTIAVAADPMDSDSGAREHGVTISRPGILASK